MNRIIYWNDVSDHNFMQGTSLSRTVDNVVVFENNLMAPGVKIAGWASRYDYQSERRLPQLPEILGGTKYYLNANIKCANDKAILFQLVFFDELGEVLDRQVIVGTSGSFTAPVGVEAYELNLLNGGLVKLEFAWLQLCDSVDLLMDKDGFEVVEDIGDSTAQISVVFLEPNPNYVLKLNEHLHETLASVGSVASVATFLDQPHVYRRRAILNLLKDYAAKFEQVHLLGYGTMGNDAAKYFSTVLKNTTAHPITPAAVIPEIKWLHQAFDQQTALYDLPYVVAACKKAALFTHQNKAMLMRRENKTS